MWRECECKQAKSCVTRRKRESWQLWSRVAFTLAIGHSSSPELISFLTLEKENLNDINHNMLFYFKVLNRYFP